MFHTQVWEHIFYCAEQILKVLVHCDVLQRKRGHPGKERWGELLDRIKDWIKATERKTYRKHFCFNSQRSLKPPSLILGSHGLTSEFRNIQLSVLGSGPSNQGEVKKKHHIRTRCQWPAKVNQPAEVSFRDRFCVSRKTCDKPCNPILLHSQSWMFPHCFQSRSQSLLHVLLWGFWLSCLLWGPSRSGPHLRGVYDCYCGRETDNECCERQAI